MSSVPDDYLPNTPPSDSSDDADVLLDDVLIDYDELLLALDHMLGKSDPSAASTANSGDFGDRAHSAMLRAAVSYRATAVAASASSVAVAKDSTRATASPRRQVGRFEIIRELGRGGSGIVLLAHDPVLRRDVALKIPRPEGLFTPSLRRRFVREGTAAAQLNHPGIIPVYEAGKAGVICYIASAYCSGPALSQWLHEQAAPVDFRRAAELIAQLADAVSYAHSRGVLHRDIKPANILCDPMPHPTREGAPPPGPALTGSGSVENGAHAIDRWVPRLTDFGLARLANADSCQTRNNALLGTPRYMAPEQARCEQDAVGPAADVYALGAVLYEIVAGYPPFGSDSELETLRQVLYDDPPSLRRARTDVPRDLEAIVLKALDKRIERRYATAAGLAEDLRRFLAGETTAARPLSRAGRVLHWCQRRPVVAALGSALAASLILGFLAVTWQWRRAELHLQIAERERARVEAQLRIEDDLYSDLFRLGIGAANVDEIQNMRRDFRQRQVKRCEEIIRTSANPQEVASAHTKLALLLSARSRAEAARRANIACEMWDKLADQQPPSREAQLQRAHAYIVNVMLTVDQMLDERPLVQLAIATDLLSRYGGTLREHEDEWRRVAELYMSAGHLLNQAGERERALDALGSSLDVWKRLAAEMPQLNYLTGVVSAHRSIADVQIALGQLRQAEAEITRAREFIDAVSPDKQAEPTFLQESALIDMRQGDIYLRAKKDAPEAEQPLRHARDAMKRLQVTPDLTPATRQTIEADQARLYGLLARMYLAQHRTPEAVTALDEGISMTEDCLSRQPGSAAGRYRLAKLLHQRGGCHDDMRQPRQAIADYQRAAEACRELLSDEPNNRDFSFELAKNCHWIGRLSAEVHDREGATTAYLEAEQILLHMGQLRNLTAEELGYLARVYMYAARMEQQSGTMTAAHKQYAKAQLALHRLLEIAPHEQGFRRDLAECEARLAVNQ